MALMNQYRALYEGTDGEVVTVNCNATSMSKAIELMNANENKDPLQISLAVPNILTEQGTSVTTVSLSTSCKDEDGNILTECRSYPSSVDSLQRGSKIYVSAVEDDEGVYTFSKWTDGDGTEYTDNPLLVTIPTDESIGSVDYVAVFTK